MNPEICKVGDGIDNDLLGMRAHYFTRIQVRNVTRLQPQPSLLARLVSNSVLKSCDRYVRRRLRPSW